LETRRRKELKGKATTDHEKKKAAVSQDQRTSPLPKRQMWSSSCIVIEMLPRTLPTTSIGFTKGNRASGS